MPRRAVIARALADHGAIIVAQNREQTVALCDRIAPEHLEFMVDDRKLAWLVDKVRNAGAIFAGRFSAEALGDYCAGPNHVLPTAGTARFSSPLGVGHFQKRTSIVQASPQGARAMAAVAAVLARSEGLAAHERSAALRSTEARPASVSGGSANAGEQPAEGVKERPASLRAARLALIERWVPAAVRGMEAYRVPAAANCVKLDAMENPHTLPPELQAGWLDSLAGTDLNRYPDAGCAVLEARLRDRFDIPAELGLVMGNGSDELIMLLAVMLGGAGRTLLAPAPSFSMYRQLAAVTGSRFEAVPLRPDFSLDCAAMLERIAAVAPACVFLAWPNNPTGNYFAAAEIEEIACAAPGLVVLDEAYFPFGGRSFLRKINQFPNLAVLRTLSKTGFAGLRLGFLAAAPEWAAQCQKVRLPYNLNALSQAAAAHCLRHYAEIDRQVAQIIASRERLFAALSAMDGVAVWPSAANFLLLRVRDAAAAHRGLQAAGILIKNLHGTDPALANCLRVTVGAEAENMAFRKALAPLV